MSHFYLFIHSLNFFESKSHFKSLCKVKLGIQFNKCCRISDADISIYYSVYLITIFILLYNEHSDDILEIVMLVILSQIWSRLENPNMGAILYWKTFV